MIHYWVIIGNLWFCVNFCGAVTGMTLFGWNREPSMTKHFSLVKYELFMPLFMSPTRIASLGIWIRIWPQELHKTTLRNAMLWAWVKIVWLEMTRERCRIRRLVGQLLGDAIFVFQDALTCRICLWLSLEPVFGNDALVNQKYQRSVCDVLRPSPNRKIQKNIHHVYPCLVFQFLQAVSIHLEWFPKFTEFTKIMLSTNHHPAGDWGWPWSWSK